MSGSLPVVVVEGSDAKKFEDECALRVQQGYVLDSSHISFVESAEYDFCSSYQAIFVAPFAKNCRIGGEQPPTNASRLRCASPKFTS